MISFLSLYRRGKHASTAKIHVEKVAGFFSKVDPVLGDLVSSSKPSEDSSDSGAKNQSAHNKKRKNNEKDPPDASPMKKSNLSSTEGLTLSQREKRAMELLASYLEECGGKFDVQHTARSR